MHFSPTSLRLSLVVSADLAALTALFPDSEQLEPVRNFRSTIATNGIDAVLAPLTATALWLVAAWVAVALVTSVLGTLPGSMGRAARSVADAITPVLLRRAVAGVAGVGLLYGPVVTTSATARTAYTAPTTPISVPSPVLPTSNGDSAPPTPRVRSPHAVVVAPGDSLWIIADRELGGDATPARIATLWPQWFEANRAVIGDDPSMLQPGQRLVAPGGDQS